jgi:hypothetical protein
MNWKALINVIASVVLPIAFPPLAAATPFIIHGIDVAENLGGTGPEKLQKAVEIANAGAAAANQIHGSELINVDAMNQTVAAGISAVVNAANMVHKNIPQPFPKAN